MPANLPPEYFQAEKAFRTAKTPQEKVEALELMLAVMPKHKGTDRLRADLRGKIAKFEKETQRRLATSRKGGGYNIKQEGAGQLALVGLPNSGKSALFSTLTSVPVEVADYPFTTQSPIPGMVRFENIQFQLIDMPPITSKNIPWLAHILRNADILSLVIDLTQNPIEQMEIIIQELAKFRIKLLANWAGKPAPTTTLPYWVGRPTSGDLPGVHQAYQRMFEKKAIILANKYDLPDFQAGYQGLRAKYGNNLPVRIVSAESRIGLDELKSEIYHLLNIIRIYSKAPGKEPDFNEPIVLKKGSTVLQAAESIHKDFGHQLKHALIWGSGKFKGQNISKNHILQEGDVIELHL
jgi:hypothetical protein